MSRDPVRAKKEQTNLSKAGHSAQNTRGGHGKRAAAPTKGSVFLHAPAAAPPA